MNKEKGRRMKLETSPIDGTIFLGRTKKTKEGEIWVGEKIEVTDNAMIAVFEHMRYVAKKGGNGYYKYGEGENNPGRMYFTTTER